MRFGNGFLGVVRNGVRTVRGNVAFDIAAETRVKFADVQIVNHDFLIDGRSYIESNIVSYLTNFFLGSVIINRIFITINEDSLCINFLVSFGAIFITDGTGVSRVASAQSCAKQLLRLNRGNGFSQLELIMNRVTIHLVFRVALVFAALCKFNPVQSPCRNLHFV